MKSCSSPDLGSFEEKLLFSLLCSLYGQMWLLVLGGYSLVLFWYHCMTLCPFLSYPASDSHVEKLLLCMLATFWLPISVSTHQILSSLRESLTCVESVALVWTQAHLWHEFLDMHTFVAWVWTHPHLWHELHKFITTLPHSLVHLLPDLTIGCLCQVNSVCFIMSPSIWTVNLCIQDAPGWFRTFFEPVHSRRSLSSFYLAVTFKTKCLWPWSFKLMITTRH